MLLQTKIYTTIQTIVDANLDNYRCYCGHKKININYYKNSKIHIFEDYFRQETPNAINNSSLYSWVAGVGVGGQIDRQIDRKIEIDRWTIQADQHATACMPILVLQELYVSY